MARGILGRKIGMTQLFVNDQAVGVTVIETDPCTIVQIKTKETDGYNALQLGYDEVKESKVTRPIAGHFGKAGVAPHRHLFEIRVDNPEDYSVGDKLSVDLFEEGGKVDIAGPSKGKGFQGVVKRWNFAGGPASHGSHFHRRPGSVGNCVKPGRVIKGKKLPGQMGSRRTTVRGLKVLRVDPERNLIIVKGATPGARGTILELGKCHG
ncbi:50S ribosomal protein L3 [Candidatus Bipolaricaulota bacterium]|jgi:large subunit ribosomal protein L3|nr:50S ribosomal protein L3 [Candidatus Bipolaricaulota bacterium]